MNGTDLSANIIVSDGTPVTMLLNASFQFMTPKYSRDNVAAINNFSATIVRGNSIMLGNIFNPVTQTNLACQQNRITNTDISYPADIFPYTGLGTSLWTFSSSIKNPVDNQINGQTVFMQGYDVITNSGIYYYALRVHHDVINAAGDAGNVSVYYYPITITATIINK